MPSSHDSGIDVMMPFVATATVTAGTLVVTATTLIACLPMTSTTSGNTYTGKIYGRVNDVTKSSATAFLAGAELTISTAGVVTAASVAGIVNAYAYGGALSTAVLMDVLLVPAATKA